MRNFINLFKNSSSFSSKLQKSEQLLLFLNVFLIPTQLGKHFWPDFSFIYSLRIDYLSPTIYLWDLTVLALLIIWFSQCFIKPKSFTLNHKFLFLLLFFLLTQSMSILSASNPEGSLVRLKEYTIAGLFGLYLASKNFIQIKNIIYSGLFLSLLLTCLLAVCQFLLGHSVGFWILGEREFSVSTPLIARFNFYEHIFLRPYATFSHPNMLAAFLILTLPIVLLSIPKKFAKTKLSLGLLAVATIFITFSRSGLILMVIQSSILFRRFWKLLLIIIVLTTPLVFVRLASIFTFDTLAVLRREQLSNYAIKIFSENPLAGVGLNNFINVLAFDEVLVGTSRFLQPVHNIFLLTLSETGLLGLLGILVLILPAFWNNLFRKDNLSRVLLGNLLMIIFLGLFDHYFLTLPQGQRLLFLILGLSFRKV